MFIGFKLVGKYQESHVKERGMWIFDPGGNNLDNLIYESRA